MQYEVIIDGKAVIMRSYAAMMAYPLSPEPEEKETEAERIWRITQSLAND